MEHKPPRATGNTIINVLEFLKNREVDDVSMGYIYALRPSVVEVLNDNWGHNCDCRTWRVRVFCKNNKIDHIKQEVTVGLYGDIKNGHDLNTRLKYEKL